MSTFAQLAASTESSRPVELYSFAIGSSTFRYSSSGVPYTIGADVYAPEAIGRGSIEQSKERASATLQVRMPGDNPFVSLFAGVPPPYTATLTILQIEPEETPTPIPRMIYKGFVQPVVFEQDGDLAILTIRSIESGRGRQMPRITYQGQCQNILGDAICGANLAAHTFIGPVSAVDGTVITVDGAGASGHDFVGGTVEPQSIADPRMVIDQSGDDLTLLIPFSSSVIGQNVEVTAGCDHLFTGDCALVFDRVMHFLGFPYVPRKDIFRAGID